MGTMNISCPMKSTLVWSKIFMAIKDVFMGHHTISWNFHGHERLFMGHELSHIIFNGIFLGFTKAMKWGISIFMTMKNGFMGF